MSEHLTNQPKRRRSDGPVLSATQYGLTSLRRIVAGPFAFVTSLLLATNADAQRSGASIDVGGLSMRYADSIDATAIALTPAFWAESSRTSVALSGTLSQFTSGIWSAQGGGNASLFTQRVGPLLGEIQGAGGGSAHEDGSRTGQLLASTRAHVARRDRGVWLGAGLGQTWDGDTWRNVRQGEAAAWARLGKVTAFASATPVVVDDSIRYTDAQLSAGVNLSRVELSASAGIRGGNRLPTLGGTAKSWGSASATGWVSSRIAVVAGAGTYPVDLTQGFPGGRFASLSLRFGSRRFPSASSISQVEDFRSTSPGELPGLVIFEMRATPTGAHELRVRAPSARSVEIMGDFTEWRPVTLRNIDGGWWSIVLGIATGIHEINMRIDGARWIVPPGLSPKSDEFAGSVGVLIVR